MTVIDPYDAPYPRPIQPIVDGRVRPRFVIRTIRDGRVRIFGRTFVPDERRVSYDGRLDGRRYAFGLYDDSAIGVHGDRFVALWGTEAHYRDLNADDCGPHVVDGTLPWLFWHEVAS